MYLPNWIGPLVFGAVVSYIVYELGLLIEPWFSVDDLEDL